MLPLQRMAVCRVALVGLEAFLGQTIQRMPLHESGCCQSSQAPNPAAGARPRFRLSAPMMQPCPCCTAPPQPLLLCRGPGAGAVHADRHSGAVQQLPGAAAAGAIFRLSAPIADDALHCLCCCAGGLVVERASGSQQQQQMVPGLHRDECCCAGGLVLVLCTLIATAVLSSSFVGQLLPEQASARLASQHQ